MKIDFLKIICTEIFISYPIEFAYLYGSYAQGHERSWSDIDIALIVNPAFDSKNYLNLEMEISNKLEEKINLPKIECDVRVFNNAPLNYKFQIVQYGKLIYSRNEIMRVNFETSVRDENFDFSHTRLQIQSSLFKNIKENGLLWSTKKK